MTDLLAVLNAIISDPVALAGILAIVGLVALGGWILTR